MRYPDKFIKATEKYNDFGDFVAAPYIRKSFESDTRAKGKLVVAACGFYELYVNAQKCTKGFLAPYISNTNDYVYCDEYEIDIDEGENVIGLLLGNGFQNNPGGHIWEFDKSEFRSAPMVALILTYENKNGEEVVVETDSSFVWAESPIRTDDYRFGEIYDANYEISGWCSKGFDDSNWQSVIETARPNGEIKLCDANPIKAEKELKPVQIIEYGDDFIYDFGECNAGLCRMVINGNAGQEIVLVYGDHMENGVFDIAHIWFEREHWDRDKDIVHKDIYICKGEKNEVYMPTFVYHGFRYVKVSGITKEQATNELLTYVVFHSELKTMGDFKCSDETVNKLQEMTRRSDISNFHYFPTDCPQREKNGWTADAALSCEHVLLNFDPEKSYTEWHRNIRKAQDKRGALPGIVPTWGWGFDWGNGPAWDCILVYLPYFVYQYRGETTMITEGAESFMAYLRYLKTREDEQGLMHIGLGDWCHVGRESTYAPLELTDSVMSMDIAQKMAHLFDAVGMTENRDFALEVANGFKNAIRTHLIDFETMTVKGNCQTSQAMCIFYNVFTESEKPMAFEKLLERVHDADDHIELGVLGGRIIFHVLSEFGHSDLAYKMITRRDFPSYAYWIEQGATTLWEGFWNDSLSSTNHHFWGDISAWFIKRIAGIQLNPNCNDVTYVEIKPSFVGAIDWAEAYHIAPKGKIASSWKKEEGKISLTLEIPEGMTAEAILESGYAFADGGSRKYVKTGIYEIVKI